MRDIKNEIVHFWFEETPPVLWFQKNEGFAESIRERFGITYDMARRGLSDAWASDAEGYLALCLVLAQFPRKIFAGQAQEFATDDKALMFARKAVQAGFDKILVPERRFFVYLPYEYSEIMDDHIENVALFESMRHDNPVAYTVALKRFATVEKFGRYPERNAALRRGSTPEEKLYLDSRQRSGE